VTDELIADARAGKPHAAPFLISLYGPALAGYLRDIASDLSDTDRELIAERAVEAAVRKIDRYDPTHGPFTAWLRGFARFEVLNWRRATARFDSLEAVDLPNPDPPAHTDPPGTVLAAVTDAGAVALAVRWSGRRDSNHDSRLPVPPVDAAAFHLRRLSLPT
jgi:DNA-directed RNA polymerase specialized sigma24 family protein